MFFGNDANFNDYVKYQRIDGEKIYVFTFPTTKEEEKKLRQAIMDDEGCGPSLCAICSNAVLSQLERFEKLGIIFTPWGMADELRNILHPKPNGSFFISPAY